MSFDFSNLIKTNVRNVQSVQSEEGQKETVVYHKVIAGRESQSITSNASTISLDGHKGRETDKDNVRSYMDISINNNSALIGCGHYGRDGHSYLEAVDDKVCSSHLQRAALIEYEAGIPRVWAEAFALMCEMPRPHQFTSWRWRQIIDGTGRLLDSHIPTLIENKWTLYDVFACYPSIKQSTDKMTGLLLWMHDNQVVEFITENAIGLRGLQNNTLISHYRYQKAKRERIMLWEMK